MSIATYTDLQTALADYLARSDLTARIPDFITLAEARMSRKLRVRDMEASASVTMTSGAGTLPTDYLEWISAKWVGTRTQDLRYVEPDSEMWRFRYRPSGDPAMFTILAGSLNLRPVVAGTVTLIYYQKIPALASNSTNWLLTRSPDLYVNFALAEAYIFTKDEDRAARYLTLGNKECDTTIQDADSNKVARRPSRQAEAADIQQARNPLASGA